MKSILIIGYGSVAQCLLPILLHQFSAQQIVILDKKSYPNDLNAYIDQGLQFRQIEITPENYAYILEKHLLAEDVLIDLSTNICSVSLIKWCHDHDVMYINTSIEIWDMPNNLDFLMNLIHSMQYIKILKIILSIKVVKDLLFYLSMEQTQGLSLIWLKKV